MGSYTTPSKLILSSNFHSYIRRTVPSLLVLLLAVLMPAQHAAAQGRAYSLDYSIPTHRPDWMAWIPDGRNLAGMSIPGTHDTMADDAWCSLYVCPWVHTQRLEMRDQLNAGIRAVDIRARHINDRFAIHHGEVYVLANFDDVLRMAVQFLAAHPSETLLMRVKQEHTEEGCTRSFAQTFEWYRNLPDYSGFIWRGTHIPTLGEVRGKIVILDDFAGGAYGIPWFALQKQDEWQASNPASKWEFVRNHLETTRWGSPDQMFVNFLSASNASYFPKDFASSVNGAAWAYLDANRWERTGVMMMDFPGEGLIDAVISHNYPYIQFPHGGYGGSPASLYCPAGYVADGIVGLSGKYIDRLGLSCRQLNPDGSLGNRISAGGYGGTGGSRFQLYCPDGQTIVGFHGRSGGYIDQLGIYCATPTRWRAGYGVEHVSGVTGGNGGSWFSEGCGMGTLVAGLNLRAGGLVDQIQTLCANR